jgi:hypothetical protein
MKNTAFVAIVVASFALGGGLQALADIAPSAQNPAVEIELAEAGPVAADRASYVEQAHAEVKEWRVKLDRFGDSAKASSKAAWNTASDDLNAAWARTREASARLETAGAADWDRAKASYRQASDALEAKWAKVRADVK